MVRRGDLNPHEIAPDSTSIQDKEYPGMYPCCLFRGFAMPEASRSALAFHRTVPKPYQFYFGADRRLGLYGHFP
jgi:hypothetical protein